MNSCKLINTCSTFVLFDLIRKCGWQTSDYREATEYHYRDKKGNRGKSNCSCNPTSSKNTTAHFTTEAIHYGKREKSEMIVTIKCDT